MSAAQTGPPHPPGIPGAPGPHEPERDRPRRGPWAGEGRELFLQHRHAGSTRQAAATRPSSPERRNLPGLRARGTARVVSRARPLGASWARRRREALAAASLSCAPRSLLRAPLAPARPAPARPETTAPVRSDAACAHQHARGACSPARHPKPIPHATPGQDRPARSEAQSVAPRRTSDLPPHPGLISGDKKHT
ncbi:predicted GPI-anchored protein 58 [Microtus ochrogaster]|uniref:Predicted GPI-anchored protein 58 n=1 Tax=Microtus ochrogaster TaxID=79684 RepID=A0ABM1AN99_MICOH|nr:predicted GPI-anchored protein 58 [Microtus ochrogaster]